MTVTIIELTVSDLPMTSVVGTPQRKQLFFMSGTAAAVTDSFNLKTYITNMSQIEAVGVIVPSAYTTYSVSAGGTVSPIANTGTIYTPSGTITPGTLGPFGLTGVLALY